MPRGRSSFRAKSCIANIRRPAACRASAEFGRTRMLAQENLAGKNLELAMRDGRKMGAELFARPGMTAPGIVMVPAVFGIDEDAQRIAWDYADQGFPVLVLDFFFRTHPGK